MERAQASNPAQHQDQRRLQRSVRFRKFEAFKFKPLEYSLDSGRSPGRTTREDAEELCEIRP